MAIYCEACGRINRDAAMYCMGCAGQLAAFAPTGPSMLEAERSRPSKSSRPLVSAAVHTPDETLTTGMWLGICGLVLAAMFVSWYLYATKRIDLKSVKRSVPEVVALAPVAPAVSADMLGGNRTEVIEPRSSDSGITLAEPGEGDAETLAVRTFYRALSNGDGMAAAALITPSKRGVGPFNGEGMTRFYRSLRMPLALQSVRLLGDGFVEARYLYAATSTPCEGRALVRTEALGNQVLIRSIRANC